MIYLFRHGEIDAGPSRRFIGQTDLPLNENGRRQARQWRDVHPPLPGESHELPLRRSCPGRPVRSETIAPG